MLWILAREGTGKKSYEFLKGKIRYAILQQH